MYNPDLSKVLMTLCALSYEGENPLPNEPLASQQARIASMVTTGLTNEGFATANEWRLVWGPGLTVGNMMFLAQKTGTDDYALAIRGTDWKFIIDWVEDADILSLTPYPYASTTDYNVRIAQGTMDGLNVLTGMTAPDATGTRMNLLQFLSGAASRSSSKAINVTVTGHSLGGALASALGPWLAYQTSPWQHTGNTAVDVGIYTFAGPSAGNAGFATYCAQIFPDSYYRVYNRFDVVPRAWQELTVPTLWYEPAPKCPDPIVLAANGLGLVIAGDKYTDAGIPTELEGNIDITQGGTYFGQLAYQHAPSTYLGLLQAPAVSITETAITARAQGGFLGLVERLKDLVEPPPPPTQAG